MSLPLTIAALTLALVLLLPRQRPAVAIPQWRLPATDVPERRTPGVLLRVWRSVHTRLAGTPAVDPDELELLSVVEAIAPGLRAGLTPADALRAVRSVRGGDQTVLDELVGLLAADSVGELRPDPATGLRYPPAGRSSADPARLSRSAASGRHPARLSRSVLLLSTAWSLGEEMGAPTAATAEAAAAMLRASIAHERRVAVVLAGPRATVRLLTALPVAGLVLAAGLGIPPADLVGSPAALASIVLGLVLLLVGRVWVARLVGRVRAGPR